MILRVTDERLLQKTGGIVQGMSGSPILQDGRIIGAVTHVYLNGCGTGVRHVYRVDALQKRRTGADGEDAAA